ncbi:hypothetical protein [Microseira wollei]|uniref:hypothetical protein n=1 Tax=Microseira wollei TaxID=467598 RepID=UPI001CFC681C|nr:hypothetical protein [Microseira wollei]
MTVAIAHCPLWSINCNASRSNVVGGAIVVVVGLVLWGLSADVASRSLSSLSGERGNRSNLCKTRRVCACVLIPTNP